jgi:glycosyltransferase involved in cell wall biosynthesis
MKTSLPKHKGKVAIIADPLDNQRAGVHVFTRELVKALIEIGVGDQLLLVRERKDDELPVEQLVIPNTHLPIGFASFRLFVLVPYLLRKRGVVAVFEPAHFGPFNLPKSIKRITMIHDLTPLLFPQYHRWHSQVLQRIFLKGILKRTDWVLANSDNTAKDIANHFPFTSKKTSKLSLGIDRIFTPIRNNLKYSFLRQKNPYFIYVGTIEPRKNINLLLEAYRTFCLSSDKLINLVLVGQKGWKTETVDQTLDTHPFKERIHLTGYVPLAHLPTLYTRSLALIYPSEYEGFGFPVLEAMACGTPVIAAKNSSLGEIGEGAAIFFRTHDKDDLLAKMLQLSKGEKIYSEQELVSHAAKFSWKTTAVQFWQKVSEIVSE